MFGILEIALVLGVLFVPIAVGIVMASRMVRSGDRLRSPREEGEVAALRDRVSRLEDTLDDVASQLERLGEQQRFTTKLLAQRGRGEGDE